MHARAQNTDSTAVLRSTQHTLLMQSTQKLCTLPRPPMCACTYACLAPRKRVALCCLCELIERVVSILICTVCAKGDGHGCRKDCWCQGW